MNENTAKVVESALREIRRAKSQIDLDFDLRVKGYRARHGP